MNKLFTFLLVGSLFSCQRTEQPNDVAARASGRYTIQSYTINGDTLYSSKGVNKLGLSEFYIIVDRKGPDSVRIGSVYKKIGDGGSHTHIKDVGVVETNGQFQLSAATATPQLYESRIEGNALYEKGARGGPSIFVLPSSSYSVKAPTDPTLEGIIITARK